MRPEYEFDYWQGRSNRFAARMKGNVVAVVLEPDVARVFHTSASVNRVLRSVISAKPNLGRRAVVRRTRRKSGLIGKWDPRSGTVTFKTPRRRCAEEGSHQVVKAKDFRRIALAFDGAVEASHMNHPDFRADGRIFATLHADDRHGMVKLTPEQQKKFLAESPSAFAPESGAWGRQGCTRVALASVDEDTLGEAMTLAWQNVTAKRSSRTRRTPRT